MSTSTRLVTAAATILVWVGIVCAQAQNSANTTRSTIQVTAVTTGDRVRFTAPNTVAQMRLEVYGANGEKFFDNELRGGNVIDWRLQNGQAEPLPDGAYLCVVTVKSLSGRVTQRIASATVEKTVATLQAAVASQLTPQQSQAVGPMEDDASLTLLKEDEHQTTTVIAHNGEDGQITRGRGALSFRIGDFFSGKDVEQMRLTAEGNLGIGITNPQVRLDVDGLIRASQGIIFPDGTIQYSAASKTLGAPSSRWDQTQNPIGVPPRGITGGGRKNGDVHPLTDGVFDVNASGGSYNINAARMGIGTAFPLVRLHVGSGSAPPVTAGATLLVEDGAATSMVMKSTTGAEMFFYQDQNNGVFGTASTHPLGIRTNNQNRIWIDTAGNVGIGTTIPSSKLEIGGNALIYPPSGPGSMHIRNRTTSDYSQVVFDDHVNSYRGYIGYIGANAGLGARNDTVEFGTAQGLGGRLGNDITFRPNETEVMRLTASGRVGIGTPAPSFRLHVIDPSNTGLRVQTNVTGGTVASFGGNGEFQIDAPFNPGGRLIVKENGDVGIGINPPAQKLHVSGTGVVRALVNSDSNAGFALGLNNQQKWSLATTNGDFQLFNDAIGFKAILVNGSTNNVGIGRDPFSDVKLAVHSSTGKGLTVDVAPGTAVAEFGENGEFGIDDAVAFGGRFRVTENSIVLINHPPILPDPLNNATPKLVVNGTIRAVLNEEGFVPMCYNPIDQLLAQCISSIRFKENVNNFVRGLDLVGRLRPVSFNWKRGGTADMGLIAEEVAKEEPLLATYDDKGVIQGVKYDRVAVVLLNAIKEQQAQIQNQQREIEKLKRFACSHQPKASICKPVTQASTATRKVRAIRSAD